MNSVAFTSPVSRWAQQFWTNCYFKFVLPRIERGTIHDIQLDLSDLSPKVRNRILHVGYEDAEREICRTLLTASDSVLEIGGGIGFVGLYCQKKLGIRRYFTAEADPSTFSILKKNYALNGVEAIAWNVALGRDNGWVTMNTEGDFWEHRVSSASSAIGTARVESITLPTLMQKIACDLTTLIIDIEGGEKDIDFNALPASVTKLVIEIHPEILGEQGTKRVFTNIREQGFRAALCKESTFGFVRN